MPPAAEQQRTFESVALQQGLITQVQVDECLAIQKKVAEAGLESSVEEILLKKGYITRQKAAGILAALGRGTKFSIEGFSNLEKIGQGGYGVVYKARQTSLNRLVAIKVLLPKFSKQTDARERFLREANALARLNHPNIVSAITAGESNGVYYYVMEYLDGETLDKRIRKGGPLHWSEALPVVRDVARALDHAHENGVIHRDIKPGNIILLRDGSVKLADLGLARIASGDDIYVTQTGVIMGTPAYISPEMARGEKTIDIRTDIYSLGITLFDMIVGRPPYESDNALVVVTKHATADLPVKRVEEKNVPANVVALLRRMTARDRRNRHQTPAELLGDVDSVLRGRPIRTVAGPDAPAVEAREVAPNDPVVHYVPPVDAPPRRMIVPMLPAAVIAVTVVGAIALAALFLTSGKNPNRLADVPPPPPRTAPPPPGPRPDPREQAAADAFASAERFEQEHRGEDNPHEAIHKRWTEALDSCRMTTWQLRCEKKIGEAHNAVVNEIGRRTEALRRRMAEVVNAGNFAAAMKELSAAATLFSADLWRTRVAELHEETQLKLRFYAAKTVDEATQLAALGEYGKAIAMLKPFTEIGDAETESTAKAHIAEFERLQSNREKPPLVRDDERYKTAVDEILAYARRRDFTAAALRADRAVDELSALEHKSDMQRYQAWMGAARKLLEQAVEGMRRLPAGEKVALEVRVAGRLERIEDRVRATSAGSVTLGFERPRVITLADLSSASLAALASRPIDGRTPPVDIRGVALAAILGDEGATATAYMDRVMRAGYDVPAGLMDAFEEVAARKILAEADELFDAGKKRDAAALYRKLADVYRKTRVYADAKSKVDARAGP